jgi:hypothetical protein
MTGTSYGARQVYNGNGGTAVVENAWGSYQSVAGSGSSRVTLLGPLAIQFIRATFASATNSGVASIQLAALGVGQSAINTGNASVVLGAVTNGDHNAVVAEGPITTRTGYRGDITGTTGTLSDANHTFPSTLATTAQLASSGLGATNLSLAIGAGGSNYAVTVGNAHGVAYTNFNIQRGAQGTNAQVTASNALAGVVSVGAVATNASITASNAVPWGSATNLVHSQVITNFNWAAQPAQTNVNMNGKSLDGMAYFRLADTNAPPGGLTGTFFMSNSIPYFVNFAGNNALYGPWNFSPSSYWLNNDQASYQTNALKLFAGSVTQGQVGARNQAWFNGTNLHIGLGGTNWLYFGGQLNVFP